MKENRRMSTCNRLDLQTLGSQLIMPKILHDHSYKGSRSTSVKPLSMLESALFVTVYTLYLLLHVNYFIDTNTSTYYSLTYNFGIIILRTVE